MLIDRVIDWIRAAPLISRLWDMHERWSPLRFVSSSQTVVIGEIHALREALSGDRRVILVFDKKVSPAGLGDMLSVALVARGISKCTRTSIVLVNSETGSYLQEPALNIRQENHRQARLIFEKFAPKAELIELSDLSLTLTDQDFLLFGEIVHQNLDSSRYMLLLIREMIVQLDFQLDDFGFCLARQGNFIGYPVRKASIAPERNTNVRTFIKDMQLLTSHFPEAKIKLFGFADEIRYFLHIATSHGFANVVISQQSTEFTSSATEAAHCSLWIQRRGGGIALPIFFSEVPFVFCSRDSVMARQLKLDTKQQRLFPWHRGNQRYHLAPFRADRISLENALRRIQMFEEGE